MIDLQSLRLDSHFNATQLSLLLLAAVPVIYFLYLAPAKSGPASTKTSDGDNQTSETKTVMQPENPDLHPPKDTPFTLEQLKAFDGSDEDKPIYVSIKGVLASC